MSRYAYWFGDSGIWTLNCIFKADCGIKCVQKNIIWYVSLSSVILFCSFDHCVSSLRPIAWYECHSANGAISQLKQSCYWIPCVNEGWLKYIWTWKFGQLKQLSLWDSPVEVGGLNDLKVENLPPRLCSCVSLVRCDNLNFPADGFYA